MLNFPRLLGGLFKTVGRASRIRRIEFFLEICQVVVVCLSAPWSGQSAGQVGSEIWSRICIRHFRPSRLPYPRPSRKIVHVKPSHYSPTLGCLCLQKAHFKSDWHRYNLKQQLKGDESVTEDQFETITGRCEDMYTPPLQVCKSI